MADKMVPMLPADVPASEDLLLDLLDVSQTGLILFRPVYSAAGAVIVDLAYEYLNPAAQRMLAQPARPTESFLSLYPHSLPTGIFAFYCEAFRTPGTQQRQFDYRYEDLDGYYYLSARRHGPLLLVSFTDTNDAPRTAIEEALRQSQQAEQQARAAAETERNLLQALLAQAPVAICLYQGEECVIGAANEMMCAIWGYPAAAVLGQPMLEAMPELRGQGFDGQIREVLRTRVAFRGQEVPARLRDSRGNLETRFFNFTYQPLYDSAGPAGGVLGIVAIAVDVTEQVLARQQVQHLNEELAAANEELAAINEELYAANEEYQTANVRLLDAQLQLQRLNEELDSRVTRRTGEVQQALAEAEHQRGQARLQQELLGQILGQVPAIIVTFSGPEHRFTFFNEHYQVLAGGRAVLGKPWAECLPEAVPQGLVAMANGVYNTGQPLVTRETPAELAHEPGQQRYFDITAQPLFDAQQQVRGVQVFAMEVSERVLARHERESRQRELQAIFEQVPVPIVIMRGPELRVELANSAMSTLWGRDPATTLGRPYFEAVPDTAGQGFEEILAGVMETGETFFINESPVQLDRAHTGQPCLGYFNFAFQALHDGTATISGLVAIGTEVTDQVVARQQVQELNERLAAINEEMQATNQQLADSNHRLSRTNADLDTFVYSASHDLKSPITNVEGLLLALREHLPAAARAQEPVPQLLTMMEDAVARFQQTLVHLTDVSRLQQTTFDQPPEAVDLPALVEAVRLDMGPELDAAGALLETELDGCPTVRFSAKNLRSVVYNLLSNAIKYRMPLRPPHVRLHCRHVGQQVVLEVHDNGLGLSETQRQELFQLFRRLHNHVPGSGVGLYMVKKIVENSGGSIEVRSEPGVGTTFTVFLPATE
ncbi:PAS domain-containing sensor histidine kinase [Hymenobacter psychrophilus]|uniref:histidine kinase n=1 Tax=Hymenobacter psychrophilus TaxID=651662 RepID=A0A1H3KN45_9BACT|nr:PAS domain-containing protein [Hymenobacter psychrophilus]SDY53148.1 PAS domain S-box-containing protein [Hymenobacter psychrophilus]